jgi:hypothetical protein
VILCVLAVAVLIRQAYIEHSEFRTSGIMARTAQYLPENKYLDFKDVGFPPSDPACFSRCQQQTYLAECCCS